MTRRPIFLIGCGFAALGLTAALLGAGWPLARSVAGAPMSMHVTDAHASTCSNGAARWTVGVDVVTKGHPGAALSGSSLDARYVSSGAKAWRTSLVEQDGDQFVSGRLIGPTGTLHTHPTVSMQLPCDVSAAQLVASTRVGNERREAQAPFVSDGIAMSASSVGAFGLVVVIGAFGLLRLSRRGVAA